jgi:predicted phage terminase large subunit-like protein
VFADPQLLERALADPELRKLVLEERKRRSRAHLGSWCETVLAPIGQAPARHHRMIIERLEAVARGDVDRLMILAPPGSAKSTYSTVLYVPWWFCRNPASAVISASHTSGLAASFGRRVRNTVMANREELGYDLSEDSRAADKWSTDSGGEYITVGVGQALAGRRADLAIVDDPMKGREAAESAVERDKVWRWYTGDLYGRLKPSARIVLIMTRWHEDDLGGRLLDAMADGTGDVWEVLSLTAVCEDPTTDPMGREVGAALWPEWEDERALERKRRVSGEREWISQYQQRPAPASGILFVVDKLQICATAPSRVVERVRCWDLAATEQTGGRDPDWTVGLMMARMESGGYLVEDVVRFRGSPAEVERRLVETAARDGLDVAIGMSEDPGQAGKSQRAYLSGKLAGYVVRWARETGSKETRAMPWASQVESGNVWVLDRVWTGVFVRELAMFPFGSKDDQVDAGSRAFAEVAIVASSTGIIDYYSQTLEQAALPVSRPSAVQRNGQLIEVYRQAVRDIRGLSREQMCAGCDRPIAPGQTYEDDGDSVVHVGCRPH